MPRSAGTVVKWEFAGAAFVVATGSALHFAFEWSGYWTPLVIVAAVNESIWEHLKLAFWPGFFWAILEGARLRRSYKDFWAVKGITLLIPPVAITALFVSYTTILGVNLLAVDIGIFVVSVGLGHALSAWLLLRCPGSIGIRPVGFPLLVCQVFAYATLTFFPPRHVLFEETRSGIYGIPPAGRQGLAEPGLEHRL